MLDGDQAQVFNEFCFELPSVVGAYDEYTWRAGGRHVIRSRVGLKRKASTVEFGRVGIRFPPNGGQQSLGNWI